LLAEGELCRCDSATIGTNSSTRINRRDDSDAIGCYVTAVGTPAILPWCGGDRAARRVHRALAVLAAMIVFARPGFAQVQRDSSVDWLVSAGSAPEAYLRVLQLVDVVPLYPWSVRAFSSEELQRLAPPARTQPWGTAFSARDHRAVFSLTGVEAGLVYNSRVPYGSNDGAVWAGRGVTSTLTAGARFAYGPVELVVAPMFFRAQNAAFPLAANGMVGPFAFANARQPTTIDLPQRFGDTPYQRLDPGQSTARISGLGFTGGISTANEGWGPSTAEPFLLGNNAAGFRHLFLGTARPLGLWGVAVHARAIAGKLDQSDYSTTPMEGQGRYLSGIVGVVTARQLPGLELGAGRLFHNYFPDSSVTLGQVLAPVFHGLLKAGRAATLGTTTGDEPDNQLASLFGRWVFPASGVEVYGEYGRDDSGFDLRDVAVEPDHDVAIILGFRKAWKRLGGALLVVSAEAFNDRLSHLDPVRNQTVAYVHTVVRQGHTERGQILGAPDLMGGGGESLAIESYTSAGHSSLQYTRAMRVQQYFEERQPGKSPFDVMHSVEYNRTTFRHFADLTVGAAAVYETNRDLTGENVFNVRMSAQFSAHW
jgi:hypothetical protein